MPLLLTEPDVRAVLPMPDLIDAMERRAGRSTPPAASRSRCAPCSKSAGPARFFGVMPAALDDPPALGAKLVTVYHRNHARGLPSHLATIVLLDPATGALVAIMDGRYITEARTAAVSAVSVRHLARPDARVLAIIGSGVQARSHLEAIRLVRDAERRPRLEPDARSTARRSRARWRRRPDCAVRAVPSAAAAVHGADSIVLATASPTPVIDDGDVVAGRAHRGGRRVPSGSARDADGARRARARLRRLARRRAQGSRRPAAADAEGAIGESHIAGELGELVAGRVAGRRDAADVTIFKSLGMAVEDVVAARLVRDARDRRRARPEVQLSRDAPNLRRASSPWRPLTADQVSSRPPASAGAAATRRRAPFDRADRPGVSRAPTTSIRRGAGARRARPCAMAPDESARASDAGVDPLAPHPVPARRGDGRSLSRRRGRRARRSICRSRRRSRRRVQARAGDARSIWPKRRLKRSPNDLQAQYDLGAAYAIQASYSASVEGSLTAAFRSAKRAYDAQEDVLTRDPQRDGRGRRRRHVSLSRRRRSVCRRGMVAYMVGIRRRQGKGHRAARSGGATIPMRAWMRRRRCS